MYEEPSESQDFAMSSGDEHSAVDSKKRKVEGEVISKKNYSQCKRLLKHVLSRPKR